MKLNKIIGYVSTVFLYSCTLKESELVQHNSLINAVDRGDIEVIAPASWIEKKEEGLLTSHYPLLWNKIRGQLGQEHAFLSNTDDNRFRFLVEALNDANSSAIWALRGGYGSVRLLPYLSKMNKPIKHKWVIGYSDITALHLFLSQQWGWKTIHGAVAKEIVYFQQDSKNFHYLDEILSGRSSKITYPGLKLLNRKSIGKLTGSLTGGNTALLSTSIGTPWQLDAKGKIVIIEESGYGNRVDRVFKHIKNSKLLEKAVALIIGDIIVWDMNASELINDFIKDLNIPVFKVDFIGHGKKNYPWIYNAQAVIEPSSNQEYQLTFNVK